MDRIRRHIEVIAFTAFAWALLMTLAVLSTQTQASTAIKAIEQERDKTTIEIKEKSKKLDDANKQIDNLNEIIDDLR